METPAEGSNRDLASFKKFLYKNMEPIDIIINNFTRLQYLDIIVRKIKERTEYPHRLIVVDNATTPRTADFVGKLLKDGLIDEAMCSEKNLPLPQAFKLGFEFVRSRYFVTTVDDTIPPWTNPCWLTHLAYLIENLDEYGAIALKYRYADSGKYPLGDGAVPRIDIPLDIKNIEQRQAIEEFFQIQRTDEIRRIGFSRKNTGIYEFSRRMESVFGKKIGRTTAESGLSAVAWDDDDWGYLPEVKNRRNFYEMKKFRRVRIVACFMAHHDDQFIDRFLENLGQFTDEFYINLNEASPHTAEACRGHRFTRRVLETKNERHWSQAGERENTIRMLDDVRPDMVLFPDTDELFCDDLLEVLAEFWDSPKDACWFELKYCWGDENTVRLDRHFKKMVHVRAFKWREGLNYEQYKGFAIPTGYFHEKHRKFISRSPVKHLKFLKNENFERIKSESNEATFFAKTYDKFDKNFGN